MKATLDPKIFISTQKPTQYLDSDIFQLIHVGAINPATALNRLDKTTHKSQATPQTPKSRLILSDATGDNISNKNPRFCELTAQYWAWKNFDADYYGFFHYRRYLSFATENLPKEDAYGNIVEDYFDEARLKGLYGLDDETIKNAISSYDIILPKQKDIAKMPNMGKTLYEQYSKSSGLNQNDLDIMLAVLSEKYPDYLPYAKAYLSGRTTYFNNMFIMRKDTFKKYSAWLFDILFECDKRIDYTDYSKEALRTPGHLAERLLNIYIAYLRDHESCRIAELSTIFINNTSPQQKLAPAFSKNNTAVVFSANDFYAPYLATTLTSIREHSSKTQNYDIIVLNTDISAEHQDTLRNIFTNYSNFSLRFYDISPHEARFKNLFRRGHFTIETWFRLLLPEILQNYDKVLYLDTDLIVESDLAELYATNVADYLLAASRDPDTAGLYNGYSRTKRHYMDNILKIKHPYNYFQAGVILFNLTEFCKTFTTDELFTFASSMDFELLDQDVLNCLAQGKVKFLDMSWNLMTDWEFIRIKDIISKAPKNLADEYAEARQNPKIIHYAGPEKPWQNPDSDLASHFWHYAKQTEFYETILVRASDSSAEGKYYKKRQLLKNTSKTIAKKLFRDDTKIGRLARSAYSKLHKN